MPPARKGHPGAGLVAQLSGPRDHAQVVPSRELVSSRLDPSIRLTGHAILILGLLSRGLKIIAIAASLGIAAL